ncbi:unnamed protein product, partial [Brassica napus]
STDFEEWSRTYSSVFHPREAETWSHSLYNFKVSCITASSLGVHQQVLVFNHVRNTYFTFSLEVGVLIAFSRSSSCQSKDVQCLLDFVK